MAIADDIFDGVFLYCPFSPRDILDEIWDLIESVSEGFLNYPNCTKIYKARFIANSSSCTTTELSKLLTSCLTIIKNHVNK